MQDPVFNIFVDGESGGAPSFSHASVYYARAVLTQFHSFAHCAVLVAFATIVLKFEFIINIPGTLVQFNTVTSALNPSQSE